MAEPQIKPATKEKIYSYDIPKEERRSENDPSSVGLRELTVAQDMAGQDLATQKKNPFEKIKMAIAEVDGKKLDWGTGEVDDFIDKISAPIRQFLVLAYNDIHNPTDEHATDFLKSRKVSVK